MIICYPGTQYDPKKETIHVDFVDFGFLDKVNNFFVNLLSRKYNVIISDKPDLLFYSDSGGSQLHRLYTCKKIFWTGESTLPDFSEADAALTPLYLDDERHMRLPYYVIGTECNYNDLIKIEGEENKILDENRTDISAVISNIGKKAKFRTNFFHEISKRTYVASGGKSLNNVGGPIAPGGKSKFSFLSKYKFNIAFENKSIPGYATEKLIEAMWARTIPIYYGDPTINEDFNNKSFININDFSDIHEGIDYILEVNKSKELYKKYLSEPFFVGNKPNKWFEEKDYLEFIDNIIKSQSTRRQKGKFWGRWKIAKRMH